MDLDQLAPADLDLRCFLFLSIVQKFEKLVCTMHLLDQIR